MWCQWATISQFQGGHSLSYQVRQPTVLMTKSLCCLQMQSKVPASARHPDLAVQYTSSWTNQQAKLVSSGITHSKLLCHIISSSLVFLSHITAMVLWHHGSIPTDLLSCPAITSMTSCPQLPEADLGPILDRSGNHPDTAPPLSYRSGLLRFRSYRFHPYYRTQARMSVLSPTVSHRIDVNKLLCRFDLHGTCNDDKCPW